MGQPKKIIIDPYCAVNYAFYYIKGLRQCFPNVPIKWNSKMFPYRFDSLQEFRQGIGIILEYENYSQKIYIDFHDPDIILEQPYKWCDVYGKINIKEDDCHRDKIVPIGPSFGIRYKSLISSLLGGMVNYIRLSDRGWKPSFKEYIHGYLYPFVRRKTYKWYTMNPDEKEGYIFAASTLWYDAKTDRTTNNYRAQYCRLCKKLMPFFEGGLFIIKGATTVNEFPKYAEYSKTYEDLIIDKRISMKDYLKKTSQSVFVFNTPSVQGCHGWKLAEYLAMGKAMISTTLENVMPGEFRDGGEYVRINTEEGMENAILYLRDNPDVRKKLKINAKKYFNNYLSPEAVIQRLVNRGNR